MDQECTACKWSDSKSVISRIAPPSHDALPCPRRARGMGRVLSREKSPTRRQSQRPWLSRSVLRAARLAPATVVAHLERWAKNMASKLARLKELHASANRGWPAIWLQS